jgi:hypothetical protein
MPTQEEFTNLVYKLLKHLEEHNNITLLAQEEELRIELDNLYKECDNKIKSNVKVI